MRTFFEMRLVDISRDGRLTAIRKRDGLRIVTTSGDTRGVIDLPGIKCFGFSADAVVVSTNNQVSVHSDRGKSLESRVGTRARFAADNSSLVFFDAGSWHVATRKLEVLHTFEAEEVIAVNGGSLFLAQHQESVLRIGGQQQSVMFSQKTPLVSASFVFGERMLAIETVTGDKRMVTLYTRDNKAMQQLEFSNDTRVTIPARATSMLIAQRRTLRQINLQTGAVVRENVMPFEVAGLAAASNRRYCVAGFESDAESCPLSVLNLSEGELWGLESQTAAASISAGPAAEQDNDVAIDVWALTASDTQAPVPTEPATLSGFAPRDALQASAGESAYEAATEHVADWLQWGVFALGCAVLARTEQTADSVELVHRLTGVEAEVLSPELRDMRSRMDELLQRINKRTAESQHLQLPFQSLAQDCSLRLEDMQTLAIIAAVDLRTEASDLVSAIADQPYLTAVTLQKTIDAAALQAHVTNLLAPASPLLRGKLVQSGQTIGSRLGAPLRCHYGVVQVLSANGLVSDLVTECEYCAALSGIDHVTSERNIATFVEHRHAPRIVVRGRLGAGRQTLLAKLAAQAGRNIGVIDSWRLPQAAEFSSALAEALTLSRIAGLIPVLRNIEQVDSGDAAFRDSLRTVIAEHPGPVCVVTSPEYEAPLSPGFHDEQLPTLTESERVTAWTRQLEFAGISADPHSLARQFYFGPGTIAHTLGNITPTSGDMTDTVIAAAKQHVSGRIKGVATAVTKLPTRKQVALPSDLADSVSEFISRVRNRKRVYEEWGFGKRLTTGRGLTALFYGPPGTGKTLVAGLIARELRLDLYRVELSRITSKWLGETEKNLARVFDACEDGQIMLLFDEADTLFAKRTSGGSVSDRHANMETNYLLQRLDSFEGVAVLTTNLEGAIDPAFRRRMSLRLQFPFPDEALRLRLWKAHLPTHLPLADDLDLARLAKRFPLSGGYIRNSVMRAAFLAAADDVPISQALLTRAIELEYQEVGKLSADGKIE